MSYISELSKEPRLIVSCFSWFARNAQVKLDPNSEISKYCGGALLAYNEYAMRGARMRGAPAAPPAAQDPGAPSDDLQLGGNTTGQ
jgi:hypothetical protein